MKKVSTKRRDSKGRILQNGESQMADGRYRYSYYVGGKQKNLYSWKLEKNDRLPEGKRECVALREQEKELQLKNLQGVNAEKMTVLELVERYLAIKDLSVKKTTKAGHQTVLNVLKQEKFAQMEISKVKVSDAKLFLIKLQQNDGKSYSTIHTIRGVLRPAFQMALEDNLILRNPFEFQVSLVLVNDSVTREAITLDQMRKFLNFVKEDKHFSRYYEAFYILFHTGMRISEFCGLTIKDLDMKERKINIDHQLVRWSDMEYGIESTKTNAGTRLLPMTSEVYECFKIILEQRKKYKVEPVIDGHRGFLYLDKNKMPLVALHWENYMKHAVEKYNNIYKVPLPKITPHICRHTYCSNQARAGMNPKTLQYLMGHSDIGVTLNTYTHTKYDDAKDEVLKMAGSR